MKYKRQERRRVRDEYSSQGGSREGVEVSKHQETLLPAGLWEFWNLRGQHNWEGKKKKPTEYATPSREVAQTLASATGEQGGGGWR